MSASLGRIIALARKETIQIVRDPRSLAIALLMPILLMGLLGYGINLDQTGIPLCTYDREGSQQSQDLLQRFVSSRYFALTQNVGDYGELIHAIDARQCTIAIVVPFNFSERIREGATAPIQAIVDATDDNTANLAIGYAQQIVGDYSNAQLTAFMLRQGRTLNLTPLAVEARTWFNESLESRNFIVPGVVAIVMAVIGTFLSSLTIAREWERGTMEQLISTPVHPLEVLAGKLAPYFVIGMVDAALCVGIAVWWFSVPFRGSLAALLAASALFLAAVLLLGFLISARAGSQLAASQFAIILTFLPSFLLSGFAFPIEQMPAVVRAITVAIPARYYVVILKGLFLKGNGILTEGGQFVALLVFCVITGALGIRSFRKDLA
jgi:ABC-2 type transport system permease protein